VRRFSHAAHAEIPDAIDPVVSRLNGDSHGGGAPPHGLEENLEHQGQGTAALDEVARLTEIGLRVGEQ
jgi:hypothetical protein